MSAGLDLAAYLARIGETSEGLAADLPSLARLHRAHVGAIPFENVDVQAGRPIHLDLAHLQDKLVTRRRGGYCFEQNTLFRAVLEALGFVTKACEARVRPAGATDVLARTHMVLVTRASRRGWLCDVGFGGDGLLEPAPLDGQEVFQVDRQYRIAPEGPLLVLQWRRDGDWQDAYAFAPEPRYPIDFEVGNWYTSAHPSSTFRNRLTAQRTTPPARYVLRNLTFTISRPGRPDEVRAVLREEIPGLLHDVFGLDVPDTTFPGLDGAIAPDARPAGA
jgi:N-hydroxyarylamine O-acetyltransferase